MEELTDLLENGGFKILKKNYFMIDTKRNIFTRIENISSKVIPSFANNLAVLARKT